MNTKIKLALAALVVAGIIGSGYSFGYQKAKDHSTDTYNQVVEEAVQETARRYEVQLEEREDDLIEIVKQLRAEVVASLEKKESGGVVLEVGEILYTNDPSSDYRSVCARIGGKRDINCDSWGVMQFKIPTVIYYYEILYGVTLSEKDALLLALDDDEAKQLADAIIFEVEGGVWNWSTAYHNEAHYAYQIPFIRSLMEKIKE